MSAGQLAPETEAIVLAVLARRVKEHDAAARAAIGPLYAEGERRTIHAPDGAKLGIVLRTDPDATWRVVDPDALDRHLRQDPEHLEYIDDIAGPQDQVLAVLAEHAPELLARVERVRPDVVQAAVARAASGGEVAPGVGRVKPAGVLSIRPDKAAAAVVERMVQAGQITWDGRPALPSAAHAETRSAYDMTLPEALEVAGSASECREEDVLGALSVLAQAYRDTRVIADDAERRAAAEAVQA